MDLQSLMIGAALAASLLAALLATLASRVIRAGLWLAASSAAVATALYFIGAPYVAVIELSVGAGLVAVLIVFTVANDVDDGLRAVPIVPPLLAGALAIVTITLLGLMLANGLPANPAIAATTATGQRFSEVFWQARGLDALAQLVLLFVAAVSLVMLVGNSVLPRDVPERPRGEANRSEREREEVRV